MALAGYNIAFKLGIVSGNTTTYKTFAGRTQDDLTIAARTRERLTKDDAGATQVAVIGQDVTFRATGLVELTSSPSPSRRGTMPSSPSSIPLTATICCPATASSPTCPKAPTPPMTPR